MHLTDPGSVLDRTVVDRDGTRIGTVAELYLDTYAARAGWLAVRTGVLGQHVAPVPLTEADWRGDDIVVAYAKDVVAHAPHHDPEMALSPEEEAALFDYYGLPYAERESATVTAPPGELPTAEDYRAEPGGADDRGLHGGAAQASRSRLVRAPREDAGAVTSVEPVTYPDDALAAELTAEQAAREEEVRRRQARGL